MPGPSSHLMHGGRVRLAPTRLGVRGFEGAGPEAPERAAVTHFAADDLREGERRVGPVQVELRRHDQNHSATFEVRVRNAGDGPVFVESVALGFEGTGLEPGNLRFLRNGWQSWSLTTTKALDAAGEPEFPSGPWLRGMHHVVNVHPADRTGWHESATVSVAGQGAGGSAVMGGVLETGRSFGVVYLKKEGDKVLLEIEQRLETPIAAGETRDLDAVRVALGDDPNHLLESFGELWGRAAGARTAAPFRAGWCSWYHFFHDVTEADLLRNLEALAKSRDEIPIEVVQLDDGYQRAIGDWLETNEKFPRGLEPIAREIRAAGFTPGIWTAPLCVVRESRIHDEHPDWLLREGDRFFRGLAHSVWSEDHWVYALDATREAVRTHLVATFHALAEMGFTYHKIDFLHAGAMLAEAWDPRVSRAARLRMALEAIREGIGEDSFLLGCGSPMGPAVGLVDAMRIGPDVAPHWETAPDPIPGLEPALPSTHSAIRSIVHRAWMHRRLWINDPDCLMARREATQLTESEARCLADAIAATGGAVLISDDVPRLGAESRALVRDCTERARRIDGADTRGAVRVADLLEREEPGTLFTARGVDVEVGLLGWGEAPLDPLPPARALGASAEGTAALEALSPRSSRAASLPDERKLAVFCDFDGTFLVQDVGSTLAKNHMPERREALWSRYESGELTPWAYTQELLDGFALAEDELDAFLETIELDPGAVPLVSWCGEHGVPFEVLSDGFDRNLRKIQSINGVDFAFRANHLEYVDGRWSIGPGHPSDTCGCGTGTCKGTIIGAYRAAHPDSLCVHVGNGRVSDLCGARAADWGFARLGKSDTLGPALEACGEPFRYFQSLHDVVRCLEALRLGEPMPGRNGELP